ncbi:hypothetical protein AVEN_191329-1 [Araneus ventricosus]|uniref:Uncharacterized protein n=1 Tax=Araneus ventricosus TaxID=182803 RepID=A0A4Y2NUX8_ARAVE|nr:hypothetical protein AVEN_191329-1 [Araneus ventricosus]
MGMGDRLILVGIQENVNQSKEFRTQILADLHDLDTPRCQWPRRQVSASKGPGRLRPEQNFPQKIPPVTWDPLHRVADLPSHFGAAPGSRREQPSVCLRHLGNSYSGGPNSKIALCVTSA